MLYIKTFIAPSTIHGIGLFADQNIDQGELIGEFTFGIDVSLSEDRYNLLEKTSKEFFDTYGWKDKISGNFMMNLDNTRFLNHSETPNIQHDGYKLIAAKNIQKGEELLDNYWDIDDNFAIQKIGR